MRISAQEISDLLNGEVVGDPATLVDRPSKIQEAEKGSISFLSNMKYEPFAYSTEASILLVDHKFEPKEEVTATLIRVPDVQSALGQLLKTFGSQSQESTGVSEVCFVDPSAQIDPSASIKEFASIGAGAVIGANAIIGPHVWIGKNVHIGPDSKLSSGAKIYRDCIIGANCVIQCNAVVGSDGFGYAPQADGSFEKIPQIGNVILEDDVELGANTVIDRATMGSTIIKKGAKLDNLIQIAHNVVVGESTMIAAQAGIAGSTEIGKNCLIGGQSGFVGHIKVADGTKVQAQSGVSGPVKDPNTAIYGSPAFGYTSFLRSQAIFQKLPELNRTIQRLEQRIKELESERTKR